MKFNFGKIASVAATALMLGGTVAAAYPAPYVDNGVADGAVVYGANAALSDASAAIDLMNDLNAGVTSAGGETTVTGGDFVQLERSVDKFNLQDAMADFYPTLDEDELSTVLAEGVFTNDANDDYDYDQEILLGSDLNLTHFQDNDFNNDEPIIGFDLSDGQLIMNYTLDFTSDDAQAGGLWAAPSSTNDNFLDTSDITMLGRTYYLLTARNTSATNHKLTLLDTANSAIVTEGVTSTLTTAAGGYDVSIEFIDSSNVILNVDGVSTNKLQEGDVYKIKDNVYVAVKNILYDQKEAGISKTEISIGSGKIVLENNQEVEINNEKVKDMKFDVVGSDETVKYNLKSYISTSGNDLSSIVLEWKLRDDNWIAPGTELVLPGFETVKLSMGDFIMPGAETTTLNGNANYISVKTTLEEGSVDLPILYLNDTDSGIKGLGKKTKEILVTNATTSPSFNLNETENTMFAVTWISGDDSESYAYQLSSITEDDNGNNVTTLDNMAGGKDITLKKLASAGDYETNGQIKVSLLTASEDDKIATVKVEPTSSGTVYGDRLVSDEGLMFKLPVDSAAAGDGVINLTAGGVQNSWTMNFTEEDKDDNIASGKSFTIALAIDGTDGIEPTTITGITTYETEDGSDKYVGYVKSDLATKVELDKPTNGLNDVVVTYAGAESYAEVYISEAGAAVVSASNDGAEKVVVVKDSEVSSVADKNLIVVGGSCINTVAAQILGSESPICGEAFSAETNVAAGQYLIKTVTSPLAADKVAMLVAGYDAEDTVDAVAKVKEGVAEDGVYPMASA